LVVDRLMVAQHRFRKGAHLVIGGLRQRQLGGLDVDAPGGIGDMGDLGIGGGVRGQRRDGAEAEGGRGQGGGEAGNEVFHHALHLCGRHPPAFCTNTPLDAVPAARFPPTPQPAMPSRASTASVRRAQRRPAKGNASSATGPICASTWLRICRRARCRRVLTLASGRPSSSAVSAWLSPSTTRATNTSRSPSGRPSAAASTKARI